MKHEIYIILAIFMGFLATFGARLLPLLIFRKQSTSGSLRFIQHNMPLVIMVVLVFYTLFGVDFRHFESSGMALAACVLTLCLQIIFKNALLSIFCGTCFYAAALRLMA